jgi:hypothetical protein
MSDTHLLTSWSEYSTAVERMLGNVRHSVVIFDRDLSSLQLERAGTIASLTRLLRSSPSAALRISVQTAGLLRTRQPRLLELLRTFAHNFHAVETPPHLAHLSDAMLIVDSTSALIRFHNDHARSKEIINDPEACKPYCRRFDEIWNEGGATISATTAGL